MYCLVLYCITGWSSTPAPSRGGGKRRGFSPRVRGGGSYAPISLYIYPPPSPSLECTHRTPWSHAPAHPRAPAPPRPTLSGRRSLPSSAFSSEPAPLGADGIRERLVSLSRIPCGFLRDTRGGCIVAMHSLGTGAPGSCLHLYGWQGDMSFPDTLRLSRHLAMCFPGPLGAGGLELAPVVVLPPLRRPFSLLLSFSPLFTTSSPSTGAGANLILNSFILFMFIYFYFSC